jgi:hypothetical protein
MVVEDTYIADSPAHPGLQAPPTRALPIRIGRGLLDFSRRKPLGAFGGLLLLVPVIAAIFLPGFDIGPIHFPSLLKYDYREYTLGKEILEAPSSDHLAGRINLAGTSSAVFLPAPAFPMRSAGASLRYRQ